MLNKYQTLAIFVALALVVSAASIALLGDDVQARHKKWSSGTTISGANNGADSSGGSVTGSNNGADGTSTTGETATSSNGGDGTGTNGADGSDASGGDIGSGT